MHSNQLTPSTKTIELFITGKALITQGAALPLQVHDASRHVPTRRIIADDQLLVPHTILIKTV